MGNALLLDGSSNKVFRKFREVKEEYHNLIRVTVFFENANFFMTDYHPLSNGVYLILEFEDGEQLHIEGANCGYRGEGPNTTVDILVEIGLDRAEVEELVFVHDALRFSVSDNEIVRETIDTSYIFYTRTRYMENDKSMKNKIIVSDNVSIDLENSKVTFYNPQRECFKGFMNLLSYLEKPMMEYYIGENSPLEDYLYLDKDILRRMRRNFKTRDIENIDHVNLMICGLNFRVVCFIDRDYEIQVIDAVHLILNGKGLFETERYNLLPKKRWDIKDIFKKEKSSEGIEGVVEVDEDRLKGRLKRR